MLNDYNVVEAPISLSDFQQSARDVNEAMTLPPAAYTSQDFYDFELDAVFYRNWLCLGRVEEVPEVGDYFSITTMRDPLTVVRDREGSVNVLSSVCRHRAMVITEGSGNCGSRLRCPYHWWSYDLNGEFRGAPERPVLLDPAEASLPRLRTEIWKGFIFASFDQKAPPLTPRLHRLDSLLENHHLERLCSVDEATGLGPSMARWDCNWKILLDNGLECYHCSLLHKGYHDMLPTANTMPTPWDGSDEGVFALHVKATNSDPGFTPTKQGLLPPIKTLTEEERRRGMWFLIAPNLLLALSNTDNVHYIALYPTGVSSVDVKVGWCYPEETLRLENFPQLFEQTLAGYAPVAEQDQYAVASVQRGLRSKLATRGRYSPQEEILPQFNRWLLRHYVEYGRSGA